MPTATEAIAALKIKLYWQEHVARDALNPAQRKRCLARVDKIKAEIAALEAQQPTEDAQ